MCSANIIATTVTGAATGAAVGGPVGAVIGGVAGLATSAGSEGHGPLGDILTPPRVKIKTPKLPDEKAETERARRRNLRRLVAGRPGIGRRQTIRPQGTGTGPTGLKQKTGQ